MASAPGSPVIATLAVQPQAWVAPYSVLLDRRQGARAGPERVNATFASAPAFLDVALLGECVVAVGPSYRWLASLSLRNVTAELHGISAAPTTASRHHASSADQHAMVLAWCEPALASRAAIDVTLRHASGAAARVTLARPAPHPGPAAGSGVGACTLFRDPTRFLTWVRYMLAMGTDAVYGYFNGDAGALMAASPALAALVATRQLVVVGWDVDYEMYNPSRGLGASQSAAMHSCIERFRARHEWTLFLDDDEYVVLGGNETLRQFLHRKRGLPCVLLKSAWAALQLHDADRRVVAAAAVPSNASVSLEALTRAMVRVGPIIPIARGKPIHANWSLPVWLVHYHPTCNVDFCERALPHTDYCTSPREAFFAHFIEMREAGTQQHHSVPSRDRLELLSQSASWAESSAIRDQLSRAAATAAQLGSPRPEPAEAPTEAS